MKSGLEEALDELALHDINTCPVEELGLEIVALLRQQARLDAQVNRRIGRFDREHGYAAGGALDTVAWLRQNCRLYGGAAADRVKVARVAEDLPAMTAALRAGDISQPHAAVIARTAETAGPAVARELEPLLLEAAAQADPGRLRMFAKHQLGVIRPTSLLEDAERMFESRYLRCSRMENGCICLDGIFDPESGAVLETALNTVMGPRRRSDERSQVQRRADAAAHIFGRFLDGAAGKPGKVQAMRPHIVITADLATLKEVQGAPPARLGNGEPIPCETLLRNLCDSVISMVATDAEGNPIAATAESRTIPPSIRRAIATRSSTCEIRGCERPAAWCDGHHLHWVRYGGRTSSASIRNVCTPHHRMHHEGGWGLEPAEDGQLDLTRPQASRPVGPGG